MAIQKENTVTLTGTYKVEQVTDSFAKQVLTFASKDRDGNWKDGDMEIYIKPELVQQTGVQPGDTVKIKGFMVFNFFQKQTGETMTFPKVIVTEILEKESAGAQQQAQTLVQPTQPTTMAPGVPPVPGSAPQAPQQPTANQAFAGGVPPVPPVPGQ